MYTLLTKEAKCAQEPTPYILTVIWCLLKNGHLCALRLVRIERYLMYTLLSKEAKCTQEPTPYILTVSRPLKRQRVRKRSGSGSVAERWQLKPEALGSTPGGATFLSCPLAFKRSTDSDGPDCVFQLDTNTIGLWTIEESRPSDSSPAVITLVIFHTSK